MENRPATNEEVIAAHASAIRWGDKVRFRHFVVERYSPNAENGVSHRQYSRSKLYVVDGVPYVHHHGSKQAVTASVFVGPNSGRDIVWDLRIASTYLP